MPKVNTPEISTATTPMRPAVEVAIGVSAGWRRDQSAHNSSAPAATIPNSATVTTGGRPP